MTVQGKKFFFKKSKNICFRCALFYHVVMAMMFSFAGNTDQLISYLGFAQWIQRSLTMCALLYIRFTNKPVHPERIQTPIFLPIIFLLVCSSLVVVTIIKEIRTAMVGLSESNEILILKNIINLYSKIIIFRFLSRWLFLLRNIPVGQNFAKIRELSLWC